MPAGILYDAYGSSILLPVSSAVYLASFIELALSSTYAQFMACFVVAGISAAGSTTVAFTVVSHWFHGRQGLAVGFVAVGSAVGGILFSLILRESFSHLSWRSSILLLSGVLAVLLGLGNLLVRGPSPKRPINGGTDIDLRCFTSPKFWLLCYTVSVFELVLFIQWGSIPTYAVYTGLGDQFFLMMTYNTGAIIGRSVPPWLADLWLGPLNAAILMNVFTSLVTLVLWLPFGDLSSVVLFVTVALMSVGTGSFAPLSSACIFASCEPGRSGTWFGSIYAVTSVAVLIGNPITLAILGRYGARAPVMFLGALLCSALVTALPLRWLCLGRRWTWLGRV